MKVSESSVGHKGWPWRWVTLNQVFQVTLRKPCVRTMSCVGGYGGGGSRGGLGGSADSGGGVDGDVGRGL